MVYIWNDPAEVPADFGPSVVTFGNFDGVHRGHQQVLSELIRSARLNKTKAVAVTFDPHPALIHRPESAPEMTGPCESPDIGGWAACTRGSRCSCAT